MPSSPEEKTPVNPAPVKLVIVDDHVFMRDLMTRFFARENKDYTVLDAVGTAAEAIDACRKHQPDVLILDINLPDKSGVDALPELKQVAPTTRVLLCTGYPTDDRIADLARTGAHGFVEKTNSWDDFMRAVERVSRGEYYFSSQNAAGPGSGSGSNNLSDPNKPPSALTAREKEIIRLIAQEFTSKEIAAKLEISVGTVETHRTNLMTKLGVRNIVGIASYAFRNGLAKPASRSK
ncbi:MAG TPA: response regulator transcription factor [Chthoniobacterales bacterium]|nr:response regulator transcription factor [Chthoniobacterales bacterium]